MTLHFDKQTENKPKSKLRLLVGPLSRTIFEAEKLQAPVNVFCEKLFLVNFFLNLNLTGTVCPCKCNASNLHQV